MNNNKHLFITSNLNNKNLGGREQLSKLHCEVLSELLKDKFYVYKLKKVKKKKFKDFVRSLFGYIDGVNSHTISDIKKIIKKNNIKKIILDGSNLGKITSDLKHLNLYFYIFFHNIEFFFFLKKFYIHPTFKNFFIFIINYICEFRSIFNSKHLIFLNKRDKKISQKFFFKKKKTSILALALNDKNYKYNFNYNKKHFGSYVLFVGTSFYANIEGIKWYIKNVVPYIKLNTIFVGKNLKKLKYLKGDNSKVIFKGYVKNIDKLYLKSHFIVAPIISGSGMKTKVAESLMFGKKVIGLNEAFVGYSKFERLIGYNCSTSKEFVEKFRILEKKKLYITDKVLVKIFNENYSKFSLKEKYKRVLKLKI